MRLYIKTKTKNDALNALECLYMGDMITGKTFEQTGRYVVENTENPITRMCIERNKENIYGVLDYLLKKPEMYCTMWIEENDHDD